MSYSGSGTADGTLQLVNGEESLTQPASRVGVDGRLCCICHGDF